MKPDLVKVKVDAVAESLGLAPLLERKPRQRWGSSTMVIEGAKISRPSRSLAWAVKDSPAE